MAQPKVQAPSDDRVGHERRRLKQVRSALTIAVEQGARGDKAYVPFYIAVGDYMEKSMERLHRQDVFMNDLLHEKLPKPNAKEKQALDEVDERLGGNQKLLKRFVVARDALKAKGDAALPEFEKVAKEYTTYIVTKMGHHEPSASLAHALFSQAEWHKMGGVTDESMKMEGILFDKVMAAKPSNLTLPPAETYFQPRPRP